MDTNSKHYVIIGGGIIAYTASYHLWLSAKAQGISIRISIFEKNKHATDTTARHLVPSLTPDEISDVIPPAQLMLDKMQIPITQAGGIKILDVSGINTSNVTHEFVNAVNKYGHDGAGHQERILVLNQLGLLSMKAWKDMFDAGDERIKDILLQANFHPCKELTPENKDLLHQGYRIDLIYKVPQDKPGVASALDEARATCARYEALGFRHCAILSPDEVVERDPFLLYFCNQHSVINEKGERVWLPTAAAIWRPGGFVNTQIYLPLLHDYLSEKKGLDFKVHLDAKVVKVFKDANKIEGLEYVHKGQVHTIKDKEAFYLFCPGENVGTLHSLGFPEPEYARFAGASLMVTIPVNKEECSRFSDLNRYMYIQLEGKVLACHVLLQDDEVMLGIGGTNGFYGDVEPKLEHEFAKLQNSVQLNVLNDLFPEFISKALGRDTVGIVLEFEDLDLLVQQGYAQRWVGSRAASFDGFPTLGFLADNGACITHVGSGGVSFCHALVMVMFGMVGGEWGDLVSDVFLFGDFLRTGREIHFN